MGFFSGFFDPDQNFATIPGTGNCHIAFFLRIYYNQTEGLRITTKEGG